MCDIEEPLNLDWGVSLKEARHAPGYQCVHEGCNWKFHIGSLLKDQFPESHIRNCIVGFHDQLAVIRCGRCQRLLWIHFANAHSASLSPHYPGPNSQPSRRAYYNPDPNQDNDELWGLSPVGVDARYAPEYCCPHEGCKWLFLDTQPESRIWPYVVGWDFVESKLTIRCPYCSRYMWVHETRAKDCTTTAEKLARVFRPICPNWPQPQQQPETKEE